MPAQVRERLTEAAAGGIEGLVHGRKVLWVEAFEADENPLTTASHEEFQKLVIMRRIDARLSHPTDPERDQRTEEFLRLRKIRSDVVIDEKEQLLRSFQFSQLRQDVIHRAPRLAGGKDGL